MKFYAVIDTNVVVSAMLLPDSVPGLVLKYVYSRVIVPIIDEEILKEYIEVLNRDKFSFNKEDIELVINNIMENSIILDRTNANEFFVDKSDIVFYEVALTGNNTLGAYLVTGNNKHFPIKPFVVTPKEMIDIINSN